MNEVALAVHGVSKSYLNLWAVVEVSFSVTIGERVAVIGPNGAGKTTLLNLIAGQTRITRGRIEVFGRDMTRMAANGRAVGGVGRSFQVPSLFPEATVAQTLALGMQRIGAHAFSLWRTPQTRDSELEDLLRRWDLWSRRNLRPGELAHGERRRLELALALTIQPRLLLLDEPTAGLTVEEGARLVEDVEAMGRNVTVLLVDHDMTAVFAVAERIIVMHRGRVLADGKPEEIRANREVAEAYGLSGEPV